MWRFIEAVQFANVIGPAVATSRITKSGGVHGAFDAGGSSGETIAGDGYVEAVAVSVAVFAVFGLSDADDSQDHPDIRYAWYLRQDGTAEIRENGGVVASPGAYQVGDVFRVERRGTTIRYFRNGDLQYTSLVAASIALRVDTSLWNFAAQISAIDGVRLFDAALNTWRPITWQRVVNATVTDGTPFVTRRQRAKMTANARPGDLLLAVMGAQARDYLVASNASWDEVGASSTPNLRRGLHAFRRRLALGDPTELTLDFAIRHESIAALLVYRGPAELSEPAYGIAATDFVATTAGKTPSVQRARPSDLVVGAAFIHNPAGVVVSAVSGATKRIEFQATGIAVAQRLAVVDGADSPVTLGAVSYGIRISGLPGGTSCAGGIVGVPGRALHGSRLLLSADTPGALGLPAEGI